MGTRADFYVGRGENAEWLGSIAFDGGWIYEGPLGKAVIDATDEREYREALERFFADCDHATRPAQGWPWPWDKSDTTDCAYAFDGGHCWMTRGKYWYDPRVQRDEDGEVPPEARDDLVVSWPDMSAVKNVTPGKRFGMIVLVAEDR